MAPKTATKTSFGDADSDAENKDTSVNSKNSGKGKKRKAEETLERPNKKQRNGADDSGIEESSDATEENAYSASKVIILLYHYK